MADSDLPVSQKEAFDFSIDSIEKWEISKVRYAVQSDAVLLSPHAEDQSFERNFDIDDCYHILNYGKAKTKDRPYNEQGRAEGISFEGKLKDGRPFLVKVGWWRGHYQIVTAHEKK